MAVKLVSDPRNAQEALRVGHKLLRANHKNIVQLHRVLDLSPILGTASCALEMEVVAGGDLSDHIEAERRCPERRLPSATVLRLSRQLLQALIYLHREMKWLHGDIKPQNMLLQCDALPADGSAIDYSDAEIKLADFGLAKVMEQEHSSASFMLSNASTTAGVVKGTVWYLSPEALQGASSGYQRTYSDDLWSACLVIYEMDTGLTLQQLMTAPGAIRLEELLTKTSRALLPLLASVLAAPDAASRCKSAAELLQKLDASSDPLYIWEVYDATADKYACMHPAASFVLETGLLRCNMVENSVVAVVPAGSSQYIASRNAVAGGGCVSVVFSGNSSASTMHFSGNSFAHCTVDVSSSKNIFVGNGIVYCCASVSVMRLIALPISYCFRLTDVQDTAVQCRCTMVCRPSCSCSASRFSASRCRATRLQTVL